MEYVKADDVRDIIYDIEPSHVDYYYKGIAEQMVLDKQQEIADMLKELTVVNLEEEAP